MPPYSYIHIFFSFFIFYYGNVMDFSFPRTLSNNVVAKAAKAAENKTKSEDWRRKGKLLWNENEFLLFVSILIFDNKERSWIYFCIQLSPQCANASQNLPNQSLSKWQNKTKTEFQTDLFLFFKIVCCNCQEIMKISVCHLLLWHANDIFVCRFFSWRE